jgi:hypothetical protein
MVWGSAWPASVFYAVKKVIFSVGTLGLLVVVWVAWLIVSGVRDARIKQRLISVKIGMSRADVLAITGKPEATKTLTVSSGKRVEIWGYPHKSGESEPPRCVFGGTNDTVIEVVFGDEYHIGAIDSPSTNTSY